MNEEDPILVLTCEDAERLNAELVRFSPDSYPEMWMLRELVQDYLGCGMGHC